MRAVLIPVKSYAFRQVPLLPAGQGYHVLTLDCGHVVEREASGPVPKRCRCRECQRAIDAKAQAAAAEASIFHRSKGI